MVAGRGRGGRDEGGLGSSGALGVLAKPFRLGEGPQGPRAEGGGGADLSALPTSLRAHCLPATLWLHLLTSACWVLAPACCRLAAPSLPDAPTR